MALTTILLVEDNEDLRDILTQTLNKLGYKVIPVVNGAEGLAFFKKSRFDLIISDVFMPEMDGNQLVAELAKYRDVPPIIMTSYVAFDVKPNPIITFVLTKPMTTKVLNSYITQALSGQEKGTGSNGGSFSAS